MEFLQNMFGEGFDLAALASGAGLFGGGASALAVAFFRGVIIRFIVRVLVTALLTGVGFLFLLDYLGFEIVPPEEYQDQFPFSQSLDESHNRSAREDDNDRKIILRSPYRRHG